MGVGLILGVFRIPPARLSPKAIRMLVKDYKDVKNISANAENEPSNVVQKANIFEMTEADLENFSMGKLLPAQVPNQKA